MRSFAGRRPAGHPAGVTKASFAVLLATAMTMTCAPGAAFAQAQQAPSDGALLTAQAAAGALDAANLADGSYTVGFTMLNASNTSQKSMSDGAIEKPLTLTVKDGAYTATVQMQGLTIGMLKGYLQRLYYWDGSAYKDCTVESTYDEIVDDFNKGADGKAAWLYPKAISFPLLNKSAGDNAQGYVQLQVFVPIMEAINTGSGTQRVFMNIDWTTLQRKGGAEPATPDTPKTPSTPATPETPGTPGEENPPEETPAGETSVVAGGLTYERAGSTARVVRGQASLKKANIAATVRIGGRSYRVCSIAAGSFKGCGKLKSAVVGKNVTSIGKQAFKGCKKLSSVTFKGKDVKTIGSAAFKGVSKKLAFKAPKSKRAAYKKLVKKAGAPKGFKVR